MEKITFTRGQSAGKTFKRGFNLGRLVCAIETEGHISLVWTKRKGNIQLIPRIGFCSKDKKLIDEINRISYLFGVGVYIHQQSSGMYRMDWLGMKRVGKLLDLIMPYLVIKISRAQLLKQFIDYRLNLKCKWKTPYSQFEKDLFLEIRDLNGKGRLPKEFFKLSFERNLRDYTPNTFKKSEEIVQTI